MGTDREFFLRAYLGEVAAKGRVIITAPPNWFFGQLSRGLKEPRNTWVHALLIPSFELFRNSDHKFRRLPTAISCELLSMSY